MKIVHMTDIHGDFETFDKACEAIKKASDAEVIAVTGDLVGSGLDKEERGIFSDIQDSILTIRDRIHEKSGKYMNMQDTCHYVREDGSAPADIRGKALDYLNLSEKFRENVDEQYRQFKNRFDSLGRRVLLVPGDCDLKSIEDSLAHENLHLKDGREDNVNGVRFVGYGSAGQLPRDIPIDHKIGFDEDEAYNHLARDEEAKIALVHASVAGFGNGGRFSPEYCLTAYMQRNRPNLVLEGHSHKSRFIRNKGSGTFISNPGNLGRFRDDSYGQFFEFETDDSGKIDTKNPGRIFQVKGNKVEISPFVK